MFNTIKQLLGSDQNPSTTQAKGQAGKLPSEQEYRQIVGSPEKDLLKFYTEKDLNKLNRYLETSINMKGVSRDGKRMIVEKVAPIIAKRERSRLISGAMDSQTHSKYEDWEKKIEGMTNEQAREYFKKNVGGRQFDTINGGLSWGNVCNILKDIPLKPADAEAMQKNGYHINQ
jgi:hypothetical protein